MQTKRLGINLLRPVGITKASTTCIVSQYRHCM